jgi:hypothetical protein
MNWEAIGAIGEILGAIGVIVSLFYVAYQVRQNTKQSDQNTNAIELTALDAITTQANFIRLSIATDDAASEVWIKGLTNPESLSLKDEERFRMMMSAAFDMIGLSFRQNRQRVYSEGDIEATHSAAIRTASTPGGKWFWSKYSDEFSQELRDFVQPVVSEETTDSET